MMAIILALVGLMLGLYLPETALSLKFLGDIFILLLKMLIIPLVVTSIFLSIAKLKVTEVKSLGLITSFYYFTTSVLACLTGIVIVNLYSYSNGVNLGHLSAYDPRKLAGINFQSIITSFFSGNFFNALNEGNIVQIVVFTFFLALASLKVEEQYRSTLIQVCRSIQEMIMVIVSWVIKIAPIGVFSLIGALVASTDKEVFYGMGPLFLGILASVSIHVLITLPLLAFFIGGFNPFKFYFQCKRALIVALSTASSTATLPVSTQVLNEDPGVKRRTIGFVLPLGATLNMDGSALYQAIVIIFLGELAGMSLNLYQEFLVFVFVMSSSLGTAGIPGGGLMMVGTVMEMVGIPLDYVGIYHKFA